MAIFISSYGLLLHVFVVSVKYSSAFLFFFYFFLFFIFFFKESHFFFFRNSRSFIYLFIYLCLCWVFVSVRGLSLVVASGDHSSSRCAGLSSSRPLLLRSTGSRRAGSVIVAHGPSCFVACGIFPDQGSNPCPLHWQADSQPLRHQGSPAFLFFIINFLCLKIIIIIFNWNVVDVLHNDLTFEYIMEWSPRYV